MSTGAEETGGTAAEGTGAQPKSSEEIRQDIGQTREELGDTLEALAEKTDVKAQTKDRIAAAKANAQKKKEEFTARLKEVTPEGAATGSQQVASTAKTNPAPFAAAGAFLLGFIVGRISSR